MINFINCLFLMDFYEPFEEMEANNVWFLTFSINGSKIKLKYFHIWKGGGIMYNNLVNEIVKKGYKTEEIAHILANLLNCSEEIIENKLKHVGEFTFQEVIKINSEIFNNEMDIKYLFTEEQDNEATYHDDIIQKSKPSKWWI
ncbi:hypothetical protein [Megamonas funiformis]|uniref:hypothetical protein n=1 Tax=Megamonas funiformis TaxID=437897 RepID=UPI003FEDCE26